jgi:hypothetical protein
MHNSYNQFYSTVFCLLYMFQTNLVVHHQEHDIMYCITRYNPAGESSCFEVLGKSYLTLCVSLVINTLLDSITIFP